MRLLFLFLALALTVFGQKPAPVKTEPKRQRDTAPSMNELPRKDREPSTFVPKSMWEMSGSAPERTGKKGKKLVLACYDDLEEACTAAEKRVSQCEPEIEVVRLPQNPSARQYERAFSESAIEPDSLLVVIGHGTKVPKIVGGETPEQTDAVITNEKNYVHQLSMNESYKVNGKERAVRVPKGTYTDDVLKTLESLPNKPQVWMMSCYGGMACEKQNALCVGSICQKNEEVTKNTDLDGATRALLDLYCSEREFKKADSNNPDGILEPSEITQYFCESASGGRPFMEFSVNPIGDANKHKENLKEYVQLYLTRLGRPLQGKDRERLYALEELVASGPEKSFVDLSRKQLEADIQLLVEPLRANAARTFKVDPLKNMRWQETPSVFDEKKTVLTLSLSVPDDHKGCFFVPSPSMNTLFTHKPHVDGLRLRFRPGGQ